jgi:hypothetical protein
LIVQSRAGNRELRCELSGSAGKTADDDEVSVTKAKRDYDYTPPPPAYGEPDSRAGKPTINTDTD